MAQPTDVDLGLALYFARAFSDTEPDGDIDEWRQVAGWLAQVFADERERARAPFLAVADDLHQRGIVEVVAMDDASSEGRKNQCASRAATYARAEHLIRQAAKFRQ